MKTPITSLFPVLFLSVASLAGAAETSAPATAASVPGPALELALKAAQVAVQQCLNIDQKVAVSVLDSNGNAKVLLASDGASARAVQSASAKAQTALAFKLATSAIAEQAKTDQKLAAQLAANPSYNSRAGAILLQVQNEIIGAIGVGGARGSEKDEACAVAGLQAISDRLN